jgi:hypothetical protein
MGGSSINGQNFELNNPFGFVPRVVHFARHSLAASLVGARVCMEYRFQ